MIMPGLLHVATRKGLLDFQRDGAAWRLQRASFVGDPVTAVLSDALKPANYRSPETPSRAAICVLFRPASRSSLTRLILGICRISIVSLGV